MKGLDVALALVLAAIWLVVLAGQPDRARRNFRWIPQMEDSLAFEAQRGTLPAVDPQAAGLPVPGTIARGFAPLPYRATPEDAVRAGRELRPPLPATEANLRRGAQVYATFCFPCHGAAGNGDGPVTKRGVPAPPSLLGERARSYPDGRLFHVVTYGQGQMPPYAAQVAREDRWKAILHVRAMQAQAGAGGTAR